MPIISTPQRLRQQDPELTASLGYKVKPVSKKTFFSPGKIAHLLKHFVKTGVQILRAHIKSQVGIVAHL